MDDGPGRRRRISELPQYTREAYPSRVDHNVIDKRKKKILKVVPYLFRVARLKNAGIKQ